jgi:hypothetical protein
MTQTGGMPEEHRSKSGLTAPGWVKATAFKAGKGILLGGKIPFIFSNSFLPAEAFWGEIS